MCALRHRSFGYFACLSSFRICNWSKIMFWM